MIKRKLTREVRIGSRTIGGDTPIAVQSMIVEDTSDVKSCVEAIIRLDEAGCEIVRVTTPNLKDAHHLAEIRAALKARGHGQIPLVADIHHNGYKIAREVSRHVDKIRINPGLFVFKRRLPDQEYTEAEIREEREKIHEQMTEVIKACKNNGTAMRIGVNHGSLSERMMFIHGDTPEGMVESALEFIDICESEGFYDIVVSLKASRVPIMLAANRLISERFAERINAYPLHLGVTEAGDGQYARIKSTVGIGTLLAEGIGDTIRVSLAEDPLEEIPVCYDILQALGLRKTKVEFIACPSCGRTKFNLTEVVPKVRAATEHLVGLDIAIMGCIVNGPGEMADADYGYVGKGLGRISIYRGHEEVLKNVPEDDGIAHLIALIKEDGRWEEPPATKKVANL
ncbi:(E)-4-hydroxy-3-methylbut-2-enyl-diphosphate synthase [Sulfidibacter corallicola]|uniref:4-hydroxy-3-methylbut-2-en-1-yl diphosphate synthase (flavodoxin) n=1 Tax=Sulfidibacter corallicola TaxID=2818388 RepID=A0A8A4TVL1_SULCO|nr:(E)-4-hydroxy-3-methylbut-2-enyl-diphosphate synthase [Sulfidibacter corallicola]QTD53181.1 (E)-4-hydroxy-3-methylbut-2-enyl-diphosphate synthase [Sulfidibacter corallicola]